MYDITYCTGSTKKIYRCDREIASEVQRPQLNLCATKEV